MHLLHKQMSPFLQWSSFEDHTGTGNLKETSLFFSYLKLTSAMFEKNGYLRVQ